MNSELQNSRLAVVLLGTAAGPSPKADRAGISTVVVVDGASYLFDCGRSAVTQYQRAGLDYSALRGIFLTHLHVDHIADYYNFLILAGVNPRPGGDQIPVALPVYGPGRAQSLPPTFGGGHVATVAPDLPTPGTIDLTERSHEAFAYSSNLFMRDTGGRDPRDIDVHDIALPATIRASPLGDRAPSMAPFIVVEDDRVRISATLVSHGPVFPAFAFRLDSEHGSVTLSGDTTRSENLIEMAQSTDVLIHEAIRIHDQRALTAVGLDHMLQSHVLVEDVGEIAEAANVPNLVLSHIDDTEGAIDVENWTRLAQRNYGGDVTVGTDLLSIPII